VSAGQDDAVSVIECFAEEKDAVQKRQRARKSFVRKRNEKISDTIGPKVQQFA
jgi:hypothetical protein